MIKYVVVLLAIASIYGCEKNIDFNLNKVNNKLVVDANIENNQPPIVILTSSLNYFSTINASILANTFVHDAVVTISNGTFTHRLKEYTIPVAPGLNIYLYGIDSANSATAFVGEFNKSYSLKIITGGMQYDATTSIPILAKKPDSLWWKIAPFQNDSNKVVLMVKTTDPPGLGNYIRYFTKKNSEPFLPGLNSVFDDQVIDGSTYQLQIDPGVDRNMEIKFDSNYFKRGDTVTLKVCNIDKAAYDFWNTWEFAQQSIGNPFAQPGKVLGNINNNALGAFYGYAAFYKTIIIPK